MKLRSGTSKFIKRDSSKDFVVRRNEVVTMGSPEEAALVGSARPLPPVSEAHDLIAYESAPTFDFCA